MSKLVKLFSQTLRDTRFLPISQRFSDCCRKNSRSNKLVLPAIYNKTLSANIHTTCVFHKRRKTADERKKSFILEYPPKAKGDLVDVWKNITVSELAQILQKDINYVEDIFLNKIRGGNTIITNEKDLRDAIKRSGRRMRIIVRPANEDEVEDKDVYPRPAAKANDLKPRPPVVTVMGHVDHGKTTLLDALRKTNVVSQEFGGITQHIGAFSVSLENGKNVTFLDTPGHAAFTAMRERGASITDIVVLVVAADDGVMEQTLESIRMAKQANVPILVAINKIDAPNADIDRTKRMLVEAGIQVESMGGDIQAVPISALKQQNLDQLTEALVIQAELLNVMADPTGLVEAVIVESKVDIHRGKLCTVIVQRGILKKGSILLCGTTMAKVRTIKDAEGRIISEVSPGYPAELDGWKDLPSAGEVVLEVENEKQAKSALRAREAKKQIEKQMQDAEIISAKEQQHLREYREKLQHKRSLGRYKLKPEGPRKPEIEKVDGPPTLSVIVKCDVDGTLEAVLNILDTYNEPGCELDLVHYNVGAITESDIELAKTFKSIIYAFNVKCPERFEALAAENDVTIKHHNVIYKLVDDIKREINARLPTMEVEEIIGEAAVLQQFNISKGKKSVPVAGCRCTKGLLRRSALYKLIRHNSVLHEGHLASMRHLKDEVDVIKKDLECGLQLASKDIQFQPGDILVCFEKKIQHQNTEWDPGF
ncbi:Elongation factor Tu GTP binding domain [Popillia japonica]|uniref:Translation initiation factor IF-2, mitochondrial n=1 Tax=Popillia japonica TaxID=7064 RepID=A0AAW1JDJ8_POPJA